MRKVSSVWMARYILRKILEDVRWKVVLLFVTLLFLNGICRIGDFRAQYDVGVAPWIAPHMLSMLPVQFTLILCHIRKTMRSRTSCAAAFARRDAACCWPSWTLKPVGARR